MDKKCEKSPDEKHHYETSSLQHAIYIKNGTHTCYNCHFCGKKRCVNTFYDVPDPLSLSTDDDLNVINHKPKKYPSVW